MNYLVAAVKPWNIACYHAIISRYPGQWRLVSSPEELTPQLVRDFAPRYVFFPHWSRKVDSEILQLVECVCFHETDVPFGRGGSPIQNLIAAGHTSTVVSALRMTETIDAGPVYMKRPLSLYGLAEEIYLRAASIVAAMILEIISNEPVPAEQEGAPASFRRRKPEQSLLPMYADSLPLVFDHIRMLDAQTYPLAYVDYGNLHIAFSRPALKVQGILCDALLTMRGSDVDKP
ncbi:MAG: methionyl-tRNA formyltransferase [Deltaproteobacteria bacterium]|jgi:methionyl-tRNA formyltransferase|nr:methionyl-tRNA formyltransferase [Deltaproteobacteria bacterium]